MIVLHLQEMSRIPFAQRRMISQQSYSLTLIEFRGMNLEDDSTVEERQTRWLDISKLYLLQYEGIFFHVRIILLQPIVLKIEILTLIKNILAGRSKRFPTQHLSLSIFHAVAVSHSYERVMAVLP